MPTSANLNMSGNELIEFIFYNSDFDTLEECESKDEEFMLSRFNDKSAKEFREFEAAYNEAAGLHELQGFINGFKFAKNLLIK